MDNYDSLPDKTHSNLLIADGLHFSLMEQFDVEQEVNTSCKKKVSVRSRSIKLKLDLSLLKKI
jgi:hypothetical protein